MSNSRIEPIVLGSRRVPKIESEALVVSKRPISTRRAAARRVEMGRFETTSASDSIFGTRREPSTIGSILELLTAILD